MVVKKLVVMMLWMILLNRSNQKISLSDLDSAIGGTAYTAGSGLTLVGTEFNANLVSNTSSPNSVKVTNGYDYINHSAII